KERTRLAPFAGLGGLGAKAAAASSPMPSMASAVEPSRVVPPRRKSLDSFEDCWLLTRYEAVEWWQRGMHRRDFCAAWDGSSLAWIELRSTGRGSSVGAASSSTSSFTPSSKPMNSTDNEGD